MRRQKLLHHLLRSSERASVMALPLQMLKSDYWILPIPTHQGDIN